MAKMLLCLEKIWTDICVPQIRLQWQAKEMIPFNVIWGTEVLLKGNSVTRKPTLRWGQLMDTAFLTVLVLLPQLPHQLILLIPQWGTSRVLQVSRTSWTSWISLVSLIVWACTQEGINLEAIVTKQKRYFKVTSNCISFIIIFIK